MIYHFLIRAIIRIVPVGTLVGCMAHARRKFFDASLGTKKKVGSPQITLIKIKEFYLIEKELREFNLASDEFQRL